MTHQWNHKIFGADKADFNGLTLEIFRFQYTHNPVYREFADALGKNPGTVSRPEELPFLPVRLFRDHEIKTTSFNPVQVFESSGTTGTRPGRHWIRDISLYEESFLRGFRRVYGEPEQYCILGLLPSYLERGHSSLVYMTDHLIRRSGHPRSGFYLDNFSALAAVLQELEAGVQPTLLLGVTFALLDFAAAYPMPLAHTQIIETGGMKGRKEEIIRASLHEQLGQAFNRPQIHAEYGMTELLSQAWSTGGGLFRCPPWMEILLRDEEDPLTVFREGRGAVNIIDLANIYSCSFLATDDAGIRYADSSFEIIGRLDRSDLRGCSLLTA